MGRLPRIARPVAVQKDSVLHLRVAPVRRGHTTSSEMQPGFFASQYWIGIRIGYEFKKGPQGQGYYLTEKKAQKVVNPLTQKQPKKRKASDLASVWAQVRFCVPGGAYNCRPVVRVCRARLRPKPPGSQVQASVGEKGARLKNG